MTDEHLEDSKCTNTTKTTTIIKSATDTTITRTNTTTMFAQQEQKLEKNEMETEKMLEQATEATTSHNHQTAQINGNENGNGNESGKGNKKRNGIDNNNTSIGSVDSGVGDVIGNPKGDIPDALGFREDKSISAKKIELIARMPTERNATHYNMNHKNRGQAIIFNHESYDIPNLEERAGTDKDCENLRATLAELHFDVKTHKNCILKEILQVVDKVSSEDHTDNDCLVIAILSHGDHGYIYAKDVQYKIDTLVHYFTANNCPSLAGKPKIFFIQACRGDRLDAGIALQRTETDGDSSTNYKIPVHADFLFVYSTIPGFYSWRSPTEGSWFIQALVRELTTNGKVYDILTLLTFVNQRVAFDYESYRPEKYMFHSQKQIPCITSMLTRILRFTDKTNKAG